MLNFSKIKIRLFIELDVFLQKKTSEISKVFPFIFGQFQILNT